jgi:hypothetical protein
MSVPKFSFVLVVFTVLMVQSLLVTASAESSEDEAASALSNAEQAAFTSYQAVLKAEQAGANVSVLLIEMNDAGELLAEAQVDSRLGKLDEAVYLADLCRGTFISVQDQADELWARAYGSNVMHGGWVIFGSLAGVLLVVFGSFWAWRSFKRRYYRQVLGMKPEVTGDES